MDANTETTQCEPPAPCQQAGLKTAARHAYSEHKAQPVGDDLITQFLPMVHKIVQRAVTYLRPPLSREDLVSAGTVGLLKAARDYDPSRQAEFQTYAYIRIRGAILDELRSLSFVPAAVNKQIHQAAKLRKDLLEERGVAPTDEELAQKLDMTVDKLYRIFETARAKNFTSIDSAAEETSRSGSSFLADDDCRPSRAMEQTERVDQLAAAIADLGEKERQVILLYYQQELTMKQIAEVIGLTEPRVSQLHAKALFGLSVKLKEWKYDRE